MRKLITHKEIFNRKNKNEMFYIFLFSLIILLSTYAVGLLIFDERAISYIFLLLGLFIAILFFTISFKSIKKANKSCEYSITYDVVLGCERKWYQYRSYQIELVFEKCGKWTLKAENQYTSLKSGDKVFVLKDMENFKIIDVFSADEYDVSLDEFELKNDRYYSKKCSEEII